MPSQTRIFTFSFIFISFIYCTHSLDCFQGQEAKGCDEKVVCCKYVRTSGQKGTTKPLSSTTPKPVTRPNQKPKPTPTPSNTTTTPSNTASATASVGLRRYKRAANDLKLSCAKPEDTKCETKCVKEKEEWVCLCKGDKCNKEDGGCKKACDDAEKGITEEPPVSKVTTATPKKDTTPKKGSSGCGTVFAPTAFQALAAVILSFLFGKNTAN